MSQSSQPKPVPKFTMTKRTVPVLLGMVAAISVMFVLESVAHSIYPSPAGLDFNKREAVRAFIFGLPFGAFALLILAYVAASFVGGLVSSVLAGRESRTPALIVGALLTVSGVANLVAMPHPLWFMIVSSSVYLPSAWLGFRAVKRTG